MANFGLIFLVFAFVIACIACIASRRVAFVVGMRRRSLSIFSLLRLRSGSRAS